MDAKELTLQLIRRWEGLYLKPYLCPAGVPTIGMGTIRYENGRPVMLTDPAITEARAYQLCSHYLDTIAFPQLSRLAPIMMSDGQRAALVDFIYNMGAGAFAASTLRKRVMGEEWDAVPAQLRRWVYAGPNKLNGLIARREDEIQCLYL